MKYQIDTRVFEDRIEQDLLMSTNLLDDTMSVVTREIMNLKDKGVREALIKLGWTPPKEYNNG
jgi:hypothetical protein